MMEQTSSRRRPLKRPPAGDVKPVDDLSDYTGDSASDRTFFINFYFMKFGTTDRIQGAAVMFSLFLLLLIFLTIFLGAGSSNKEQMAWLDQAFRWLGSAFLFAIGIALGRSGRSGPGD